MRSICFSNVNPISGPATWHSSHATRSEYNAFTSSQVYPHAMELTKALVNAMPNLDMAIIFGQVPYEQVVGGGGALQSGWLPDDRAKYLLRYQDSRIPHMLKMFTGWKYTSSKFCPVNWKWVIVSILPS